MSNEERIVRELMQCSPNPAKEIADYFIEESNYIKKVWYTITCAITISLLTIITLLCL